MKENQTATTIGALCSLRKETCAPREYASGVYIGLEHIDSGRFLLSRHGEPSEVRSAKARFYTGDVLYGKLRPYLDKAVVAETEGICSTDILVLEPRVVPSWYLCGVLHTDRYIEHAKQTTHGVNHPRTSWSGVKVFETLSFSLPEQKKIAVVLLKIQKAIETQEKIIQSLRDLKKTTMQHLFTHGLRGEKTKMTEIGEIPESWGVVALGSIASIKGGKRLPRGKQLSTQPTPYPYIRVTDLNDNSVSVDQLLFVPEDIQPAIARYIIRREDIYVSIAGTTGIVGVIPKELDGAQLTENAARIILTSDDVIQHFVMRFLDSSSGQSQIVNLTTKTSQPKLALARIKLIQLPLPKTTKEQENIHSVMDGIDKRLRSSESKKAALQDLFKTTLNKLTTGEIRVKDLDIDVRGVES